MAGKNGESEVICVYVLGCKTVEWMGNFVPQTRRPWNGGTCLGPTALVLATSVLTVVLGHQPINVNLRATGPMPDSCCLGHQRHLPERSM